MAYATASDVESYTGIAQADLPDDIDRLLNRANEIIDEAMLNNYDPDDADHVEAAKDATCAQIEYWLSLDEEIDIINYSGNIQISKFEMNMDSIGKLAPRAKRKLVLEGLLYRGVGTK